MRTNYFMRLTLAAVVAVGFACPATASGGGKSAAPTKDSLSPQSLPKLLTLIRPQPNEWRHLQVQWITDVVAARKQAAKEDKPLVILYTGGAGYNEPLGVC
jgi:hypothetical protein